MAHLWHDVLEDKGYEVEFEEIAGLAPLRDVEGEVGGWLTPDDIALTSAALPAGTTAVEPVVMRAFLLLLDGAGEVVTRDDLFGHAAPEPEEGASKPILLVAACALVDIEGRVLLARRPEGKTMAGLWEFPGG